jgi:flagellar biosynthetic protein FliO
VIGTAWAQAAVDTLAGGVPSAWGDTNYPVLLGKTVLYLALLSFGLYAFLKWVFPRLFGSRGIGGSSMKMVDRLPIGGNRSVCIVKAGRKHYLIGVTDGQIQLLSELGDEDVESYYSKDR